MGCAQSTQVKEVVDGQQPELTPHQKLLAHNQELAERRARESRPAFVKVAPPSGGSPSWGEDPTASSSRSPGSPSPSSPSSPSSIVRPPSLADGPDSPLAPSWRIGPDADLVFKAGTLSLYTHDTGTWESAFFELAQWSGDGRFCLRYKRFRGDERWRQCWRIGSNTEVRRGAQRSTLSMRGRMSDSCPSGVATVTALEPRDQGGKVSGGSGEEHVDDVLIGTRYELTIDEWANRIEELVLQSSAATSDATDETRPALPPDAPSTSAMTKVPDTGRSDETSDGTADGATPTRAAMRCTAGVMLVEDLSMVAPTSPMLPVRPHSGDASSPSVLASSGVSASVPAPPPAPLPPAPPGETNDSGLAMRSGVAARRRAMGGGLNPEREWNPRDRNFDPFADKVSQTTASLASALAELGGLPSSDGRVYGVGGKVVLPEMGNLGVDPDTSDDEISSVGGGSDGDGEGSSLGESGIAPGRSAALAKRRSGGLRGGDMVGVDVTSIGAARKRRGNESETSWKEGSKGRHSKQTLAVDLPDAPNIGGSSYTSLSSFPKIS